MIRPKSVNRFRNSKGFNERFGATKRTGPTTGPGKEESYFPGDVNSIEKVRAAAKELERIREFLLQLTCRGPESYSALTRPAAQIDKAYRLIKEFIEPKARPERWWER